MKKATTIVFWFGHEDAVRFTRMRKEWEVVATYDGVPFIARNVFKRMPNHAYATRAMRECIAHVKRRRAESI
jgi:hypothetical protein